jgi:hypothetical protein
VEIAAATKKWRMRRSILRRLSRDEVDVVRSARPCGVKDGDIWFKKGIRLIVSPAFMNNSSNFVEKMFTLCMI